MSSRGALHQEGDPCPGRELVSCAGDPLNTGDPRPGELCGETQVQRVAQNFWLKGPLVHREEDGREGGGEEELKALCLVLHFASFLCSLFAC